MPQSTTTKNTILGFLAVLFWSTNVAFSRSLTEELGVVTAGTSMFLLGGLLSVIFQIIQKRDFHLLRNSSRKYLIGCGLLFVVNTATLQIAIGLSANHTQTLVVGLINYLWPVMSIFFSIFILQKSAKWWLAFGILLALGGMVLATTGGDFSSLRNTFGQPNVLVIYGLALIAAVTWGLYSNYSRKWASDQDSGSVPVFMLATGLVLGTIRLFVPEHATMSTQMGLDLTYQVLFPTILAYIFWDAAVRKGKIILVVAVSYFIPLLSTIISSIKLGVHPGWATWAAALLIIAGAWVCKAAIPE